MEEKNEKTIAIRLKLDNERDREFYMRLVENASGSPSLSAYARRVLEEHHTLNIKIADREEFYNQILSAVREEMQTQGMKLVGALLAGIESVPVSQVRAAQDQRLKAELPEECEELPAAALDYLNS